MRRIKLLAMLLVFFGFQDLLAQSVRIIGKVFSTSEAENIHIINKSSSTFTITDKFGNFEILAKLQDTLVFSSIQYQKETIVVTNDMMLSKTIFVKLKEKITELDEVLVGKTLSGDLLYDIKNTEGHPPINFNDVGIPGYKGKIATQSERRLSEAGEFKPHMLLGLLAGGVPLNPILNGISGRTKMLKKRVDVEMREALMQSIKRRLAKDFFVENPLDENLITNFFYFCADDEYFLKSCKNQTDLKILMFLKMKYDQYLENINTN